MSLSVADLDISAPDPEGRRRRRLQLGDEAAAYIRELIMSGQLSTGDFIRPDFVAAALGSSATPVREALVMLRGEGFIEQAPHRGFRVASLSGADIRDLFASQALLAGELAARSVQRCTDAQVVEIIQVQAKLELALARDDLAGLEVLNHEFHRLINLGARSPRMAWLLKLATTYVPRRFFAMIAGWAQASAEDHVRVVESFQKRAPQEARQEMSEHFIHAGELLAAHHDTRHIQQQDVSDNGSNETLAVWP
ncbi:MAG: GntR family transcriptional regulator [Actinomycetota bacterium]|nr:GntR family transcriptional regulator [Actinomycetota bacterium]